jgi:hypothetical protein
VDESQRQVMQRLGSTVARRLAHLPLAGLRAAAAHASTDAVDAFFREAKLTRSASASATGILVSADGEVAADADTNDVT